MTSAGAQIPTVTWGPALGTGTVSSGMTYSPSPQPIFHKDGKVTRVGFDDIAQYRTVEGRCCSAASTITTS